MYCGTGHRLRWQVLGLRNFDRTLPVCAWVVVALTLQPLHGHGMQLTDEVLCDILTRREVLFDEAHRLLDVGHLAQLVAQLGRRGLQTALHVVGQRGVVALDTGRAQALQHVEDVLELEEDRRWGAAAQLQTTQMLKLGDHIDQRRVECGIQQPKVVVVEGRHVRGAPKELE